MENKIVIDATESVLGRIASFAAKQALFGKTVAIVNCNNAIVLGNKSSILREYLEARARGGAILKGPNFPKIPERLMKRTVRGMLQYTRGRGEEAFKRVKCYNEVPEEFKSLDKIVLKKQIRTKSIKLSKLGELM